MATLPTDERVVGEPRCCWKRYGGRQSLNVVNFGYRQLVE